MRAPRRHWSELSTRERTGIVVGATIQLSLAAAAWTDLARRPPAGVNGPKAMWAAIIAVNFVGPCAYFLRGRRSG